MRLSRWTAALGGLAAVQVAPALTALSSVRLRLFPHVAGFGDPRRVALTFDDGPDPGSTPRFAEALAGRGVRATFFLLGSMLVKAPYLARDLVAAGHEVGVHGWHHRNHLLQPPVSTYRQLRRTYGLVAEVTGVPPRFFRPPYGVLTTAALLSARRLDLTPVLWTCWGKDWKPSASPGSVLRTVRPGLTGGATVLLHDSDCASAPYAWRSTLRALPALLDECARRGLVVGPLGEHRLRRESPPRPERRSPLALVGRFPRAGVRRPPRAI